MFGAVLGFLAVMIALKIRLYFAAFASLIAISLLLVQVRV